MRTVLKYCAKALFLFSGYLQLRNWLYKTMKKSPISVLTYHRIDDDPADVNAVSPANFERQMAYLKRHYRVITVAELLTILERGHNTERAVVVTFDDGYRDNYCHALPILKKHDITACFFIATGFIGTKRAFPHDIKRLGRGVPAMDWHQVGQLRANKMEIGSHTVNHVRLSECEMTTLSRELSESRSLLENASGGDVEFFAFPFGKPADCPDTVLDALRSAGYRCNFSSCGGMIFPSSDPFRLRRLATANHHSLFFFRAWIEGWKV